MSVPALVRVKLSSEAAGAVSMTPVVVRDMPFDELIAEMSAVCGKDRERALEILERGSLTSGATRFRWEPLQLVTTDLDAAFARLPDPEPARAFAPERCVRILFTAGTLPPLSVDARVARDHGLFSRASFFDALVEIAAAPAYVTYNYRERGDVYRAAVDDAQRALLQKATSRLRHKMTAMQIVRHRFERVDYIVAR